MTPQTPLGGGRQLTPLGQARGAAGNGLLNNLIAYWPGNEASGNALDLHTNALHLTDVNTVTSNPGLVYLLARQYAQVNSENHTRPADDALLSGGNVDLTIASFVYLDSNTARLGITGKWAVENREHQLRYDNTANRFQFLVTSDGELATSTTIDADTFGAPALTTWYLVIAHHDATTGHIGIQVNNGAIDTVLHADGVFDGTAAFQLGRSAANVWDGRIGPTMFWKSAPGGGGVLTADQRTALYNGGAGLTYAAFTS
jgi:hypothetical protein